MLDRRRDRVGHGVSTRGWSAFSSSLAVVTICLATFLGPSTAAATECANEAIRVRQGLAGRRGCRAYEFVSPLGSAPSLKSDTRAAAAVNGERFGYYSWDPYPGEEAGALFVLSSRTAGGWTTQPATPPQGGIKEAEALGCAPSVFYSAELDRSVLADGYRDAYPSPEPSTAEPTTCEGDTPALIEGEPRGVANLFLHDTASDEYQLIDGEPIGGAQAENAYLVGATPNLDHIVFSEQAPLTPEALATPGVNLYEWTANELRLVSILPGGEPAEGELADGPAVAGSLATLTHPISADGETLFFYNHEREALYVRANTGQPESAVVGGKCVEPGKACTMQVDAVEAGAEGPGGWGIFLDASADSSRVFFTDERRLTRDATALPNEPDIYELNVPSGKLRDLTVDASEPADVIGYVGAGEEGGYLYFVARGKLASGAATGAANLYVRDSAGIRFIAQLSQGGGGNRSDTADWHPVLPKSSASYGKQIQPHVEPPTVRVSASGRFLAFDSVRRLTGYDNRPVQASDCAEGDPCSEIFLYDALNEGLACVSCNPDNTRPAGPGELTTGEPTMWKGGPPIVARNLLEDGRVFFNSRSPLAPGGSEGVENVYEYAGGELALISSGVGHGSEFLGASASGDDVFFSTDQALVGADIDNGNSVYDARVNGGFAASEAGEAREFCASIEKCRQPPIVRLTEVPEYSSTGTGAGNLLPRPGKVHSRAQRLRQALRRCAHRPRSKRASCRRRARLRFGPSSAKHQGHKPQRPRKRGGAR